MTRNLLTLDDNIILGPPPLRLYYPSLPLVPPWQGILNMCSPVILCNSHCYRNVIVGDYCGGSGWRKRFAPQYAKWRFFVVSNSSGDGFCVTPYILELAKRAISQLQLSFSNHLLQHCSEQAFYQCTTHSQKKKRGPTDSPQQPVTICNGWHGIYIATTFCDIFCVGWHFKGMPPITATKNSPCGWLVVGRRRKSDANVFWQLFSTVAGGGGGAWNKGCGEKWGASSVQ